MRVSKWAWMTLVTTLWIAVGSGLVWADATPAPGAQPIQRQLTDGEKALLKKILLYSSADPDDGPAPLTVRFTVEPYDKDEGVNARYVWDFGDGSKQVREQNPTHTYKKPGEYKAIVKVTNDQDQAGKDDLTITVEEPEKK